MVRPLNYRSPAQADDALPGPGKTAELPLAPAAFRAAVKPGSVDAKARTFSVVFTTGADVVRYTWGGKIRERLALGKAVDLVRLRAGAPFLASHRGYDVDEVRGVVLDASVDDKQGVATIKFPAPGVDQRADMLFAKIEAGIVTGASVGYSIERFEEIESDDDIPTFLATRWTPFEISAVPMPADLGAGYRSGRDGAEHYAARDCAVKMRGLDEIPLTESWITERTAHIHDTGIRDAVIAEGRAMVKRGATTKEFIEMSTKRLADEDDKIQTRGHVIVGDDRTHTSRQAGMRNALLHRAAPHLFHLEETGRQYRGMSLLEMGREAAEAAGTRTRGMSKMELAATMTGQDSVGTRAGGYHSTSDFPLIAADVANKALRKEYDEAPQTFQTIGRKATLQDFKPAHRTQLGEAPRLLKVVEGAEYTSGTMGDAREAIFLLTYGRKIAFTRQLIINDDMDAFGRMFTKFARSARNLESDLFYEHFLSNPAMSDSENLFSVAHANIGTGVIGIDGVSAGRAAMRQQKGIDGGQYLNIGPKTILVPTPLETKAQQVVMQIQASKVEDANPFAAALQVAAEPRLDDVSPEEWYLAADPAAIDTIEYAFLEGEEAPFIETRIGFDIDGIDFKCRHDFGVRAIDWRGLFQSDGQVVEP